MRWCDPTALPKLCGCAFGGGCGPSVGSTPVFYTLLMLETVLSMLPRAVMTYREMNTTKNRI